MSSYYANNKATILAKYHENFIKMIEYQLSYYYKNRLDRIQYQLKYHSENKEQYVTYQHSYYEKNKDKLLASRAERVLCSCNKLILKGNLSQHLKTNLHLKLVNILNKHKNNNINKNIDFIIDDEEPTIDDKVETQFIKKQSYYQANKERIAEKIKKSEFRCICGKMINKSSASSHYKSKKHLKFVTEMNDC